MAHSKSLLAVGIAILLCLLAILAFLIFSRKSEERQIKAEIQDEEINMRQANAAADAMTDQMVENFRSILKEK